LQAALCNAASEEGTAARHSDRAATGREGLPFVSSSIDQQQQDESGREVEIEFRTSESEHVDGGIDPLK
jgi:hypothetical protein